MRQARKAASLVDIESRIRNILIARLQVDASLLEAGDSSLPLLGRGVGLDSFEALALAAEVEQEFNLQIDDSDLTVALFRSIADLALYVAGRTSTDEPE
jgi:acyl carrier protein